jgi:glycine dehydrogenase
MSLQTREQHIRREKATSNICTAQALLANISALYAMYHGPDGLYEIANKIHIKTVLLAETLKKYGFKVNTNLFFDTITIKVNDSESILKKAEKNGFNLRKVNKDEVGISLNEKVTKEDFKKILQIFEIYEKFETEFKISKIKNTNFERKSKFLTHKNFNSYHTEHEMLRLINKIKTKDISLANSMIPLGSCTMKLSSTSEMIPITWNEFSSLHPFAPLHQTKGYQKIFNDLETIFNKITNFHGNIKFKLRYFSSTKCWVTRRIYRSIVHSKIS